MKKIKCGSEFKPTLHTKSNTHGFTVIPNPYENKWDHIPVKVGVQSIDYSLLFIVYTLHCGVRIQVYIMFIFIS